VFLPLLNCYLTLCFRPHCLLLPYDIQHLRFLPLYQFRIVPGSTLDPGLLVILAHRHSDSHGLIISPLLAVLLLHMLAASNSYISLYLLPLSVDLLPDLTAHPLAEALLPLLAHHPLLPLHRLLTPGFMRHLVINLERGDYLDQALFQIFLASNISCRCRGSHYDLLQVSHRGLKF
jgi:hypothetical protein